MRKCFLAALTLIVLFQFSTLLTEAAQPKKTSKQPESSKLENNLKDYFSKQIPNATISSVKVIKSGEIVSVRRKHFLTDNIIEDIEKPVLVNIKGRCKYSDKRIDENIKQVLHKDEWGEWVPGQGTTTEGSLTWAIVSAALTEDRCPPDPAIKQNREAAIGTFLDTRTGLMWAAKDNGANINWNDANNYCQNYRAGGYTDWRMPTNQELMDIYDPSRKDEIGRNTIAGIKITEMLVWSVEAESSMSGKAAYFDFKKGKRNEYFKSGNTYTRALPVRGISKVAPNNDYIVNADETVLDKNTNLMWAVKDNGSDINYHNAKLYCENYKGGGYTDWRIPTSGEVAGLLNSKLTNVLESPIKVQNPRWSNLWASETRGSDAASFEVGSRNRIWHDQSKHHFTRVVPVRTVKMEATIAPKELGEKTEKATSDAPVDPPKALDEFNTRMQKGRDYFGSKQYQLAIKEFEAAIHLQPEDYRAYYNRGQAYANLDQLQPAIEDFNEAIRLAESQQGNIKVKEHLKHIYNTRGLAYLQKDNDELGCSDAKISCKLGECSTLKWARSQGFFGRCLGN